MVKMKPKFAFTLSELLITLSIIGVVAALTIPTLMSNYQKVQHVTQIKKAYAEFNQVLQQMAADNGTVGDISSYFGSTTTAGKAVESHYKIIKSCGTTLGQECFASFDNNYDGSAHSTSDWASYANPNYKFVTADGVSISVNSYANGCTNNWGHADVPDSPVYNSSCGYIYIDANGTKKPNYLGRDVFIILITNKKTPALYPFTGYYTNTGGTWDAAKGGDGSWNYNGANRCGKTTSKIGRYCLPRIIDKGWVMDY